MTIKISYNDLVSYLPRKGEVLAGLPLDGKRYTAAVKSVWVDEDAGGVTMVSLVGGPDLKFGGSVKYDRKRFQLIEKDGGSIPTPVATDRAPAPVSQEVADSINDAKPLNKKERTLEIYRAVMAAGGKRKDGIVQLTGELGMSMAAASTYWQNCKSGKWS